MFTTDPSATESRDVPIHTLHLFEKLDGMLIDLLRSLTPEQWNTQTIAKQWQVKNIASHLLDGNLRTISHLRDLYFGEKPENVHTYQDLVSYLNQLNGTWVNATKRLSPQVITELLESTGKQYHALLKTLNPFEKAIFSVAWAGDRESQNWFHIAREYTEKYLHQQQVREAVNKPGLLTKELFYPFIDTLMRGLPYTFRNLFAETGTALRIVVSTDIGGDWYITKKEGEWHLSKDAPEKTEATLIIDPSTAWKLFSKGITPETAKEKVLIHGRRELAETALAMVSVMA